MTESFGRVRARFPVFHLVQMLERQVLRYHLPAAGPLCRPVDRALAASVPRLRPYGYFMLVELRDPRRALTHGRLSAGWRRAPRWSG